MEYERVLASTVVTGDVVLADQGWCSVEAVRREPDGSVTLALKSVRTAECSEWQREAGGLLTRTDPAVVHEAAEFLGMDIEGARAWAAALGWSCRHHSHEGFFITDDLRFNRINLWTDSLGTVIRAEMY